MQKQNILVTGGLGYVGSRLTPLLLARGHAVRVLDLCLYGEHGLVAMQGDPPLRDWQSRFELVRGAIDGAHQNLSNELDGAAQRLVFSLTATSEDIKRGIVDIGTGLADSLKDKAREVTDTFERTTEVLAGRLNESAVQVTR